MERLRQETLHLTRAADRQLIGLGQLVHAHDGDDILQLLIALEDMDDGLRHLVVLLADNVRRKDAGRGVQRVDGGVNAERGDGAVENRRCVQMRERGGRRGVGQIVRRDIDCLHRRDRAVLRGRDTLLQCAHFGCQRGLVADGGRHTTEKRGDLGAGLRETEDVVDKQKHVLMLHVAEILRHRKAGQTHAHTRSGRFVHLAEDQRGFLQNAGLLHFVVQVVALTGTLADAGEDGVAVVFGCDVVDQLLNQNGLADACAAEQTDLAALCVRADQVDDLDAGFKNLRGGFLLGVGRCLAVNGPAFEIFVDGLIIQRVAHQVENTTEASLADRNGNGGACVDGFCAAH